MKRLFMLLIVLIIITLSACTNDNVNTNESNEVINVEETENIANSDKLDNKSISVDNDQSTQRELISDFLIQLYSVFRNQDRNNFQKHIDEYGVYSITYFADSRDPNRVALVFNDDIRDDLFLVSSQSGIAGIGLRTFGFGQFSEIYYNESIVEDSLLQEINWLAKDEQEIQSRVLDVIEGCHELILKNNQRIPQVFTLKDDFFAFTFSSTDENKPEYFNGQWILFEENNGTFIIRAIVEMQ